MIERRMYGTHLCCKQQHVARSQKYGDQRQRNQTAAQIFSGSSNVEYDKIAMASQLIKRYRREYQKRHEKEYVPNEAFLNQYDSEYNSLWEDSSNVQTRRGCLFDIEAGHARFISTSPANRKTVALKKSNLLRQTILNMIFERAMRYSAS
mmetsp:Transcript_4036/g.5796  ORF Transcript_4036/g.5796 Transcript_4036/m.5796 type:complete len:150 (+) Transcript_4036:70-519(+)